MKVRFSCTACGKAYEVDDMLVGKRTKCRECGVAMRVPHPAIELGPADGPMLGTIPAEPVAYATAIPEAAVEEAPQPVTKTAAATQAKPWPKAKRFEPSPRGRKRTPAWVGQMISFVLGCATTAAVILLYSAAHPATVPAARAADPDVAIKVRFENGNPPDAVETQQRVIATVTKELNSRNMNVKSDAPVICYAVIGKSKVINIQPVPAVPAATEPAEFHEELLDVRIEFQDAAKKQFWRSAGPADMQRGIDLHPDKLVAAAGATADQALSLQQWKEAADRFSQLSYPDAGMVRDAETAVAGK